MGKILKNPRLPKSMKNYSYDDSYDSKKIEKKINKINNTENL